ncbi:MAG: alpha/beta hydrolase [Halobacteriales archaeon]|nr:alpha/beta hydrolase [Halobacteriales archaeon]
MRLRTLTLGAVGAVGGLLLGNRTLRADGFEPPLGHEQRTFCWRGFDIAYTELGDPEDADLVLLHGLNAAGSSHEFVHVAERLAEEYHVLAPDLPGFGGSERPPLLYSGSLYAAFVTDFLREQSDDPIVVASSLAAAYATRAASEVSVAELLLICPTPTTIPGERPFVRSLLRSPVLGEGLYNLLASKPSIRWFLADHGFSDADAVTDEWVEYDWQTAHQPNARFAPASFIAGFLDLDADLGAELAALDVPVSIVWGSEAEMPEPEVGRAMADTAGASFTSIDGTDLLPHAEQPTAFLETFESR